MQTTTLFSCLVFGAVAMRAVAAQGDGLEAGSCKQGSAAWRCEAPQPRVAPAGVNAPSEISLSRLAGAKVAEATPVPSYPSRAAAAGCEDQTLRVRLTIGTGGDVLRLDPGVTKAARGACEELFAAEVQRTLKQWRFQPAEELSEPSNPHATRQKSVGEVTCEVAFRGSRPQRH